MKKNPIYLGQNDKTLSYMPYLYLLVAILLMQTTNIFAEIKAVDNIGALTTIVKDQTQTNLLPIILNAAGIAVVGFAALTSRWTTLFYGGAYLAFVNVYFGFVNGMFAAASTTGTGG